MRDDWSKKSKIIITLIIGLGLFSTFSLLSEFSIDLVESFKFRAPGFPLPDPIAPEWYASLDWWWKTTRKLAAAAGVSTLFYAIFFGPWWQIGSALMMFLTSHHARTHNRDHIKITVHQEHTDDTGYVVALIILIILGMMEPFASGG